MSLFVIKRSRDDCLEINLVSTKKSRRTLSTLTTPIIRSHYNNFVSCIQPQPPETSFLDTDLTVQFLQLQACINFGKKNFQKILFEGNNNNNIVQDSPYSRCPSKNLRSCLCNFRYSLTNRWNYNAGSHFRGKYIGTDCFGISRQC